MDIVYFLLRHAPFWTIPLMFISAEFGYSCWIKDNITGFRLLVALAGLSFLVLGYYVVAGGPEKSVQILINFLNNF